VTRKYGWKPDFPDHRDLLLTLGPPQELPPSVSLRPLVSVVFDQGDLGSCTANAIGQAIMIAEKIQKDATINPPSRLFIYYNERDLEGTVSQDSGAQIRDGIKTVAAQGACLETTWPYDMAQFAEKPSAAAYTEGRQRLVEKYLRVSRGPAAIKKCLAGGFPFVLGISVFDSFESQETAASGNVPMPQASESMIGGHAVCCVGYNDGPDVKLAGGQVWPGGTLLVQNSWGTEWGLRGDYAGCFTLPYEYLAMADDLWTIRMVEG
jgi:C1A family cysteine protease